MGKTINNLEATLCSKKACLKIGKIIEMTKTWIRYKATKIEAKKKFEAIKS